MVTVPNMQMQKLSQITSIVGLTVKKAFSWGHIQVHTHTHSPLSAGRALGNSIAAEPSHFETF